MRAPPLELIASHRRAPVLLALALLAPPLLAPRLAGAANPVEQEHRLIDEHSLLLDLPAMQAPAALSPWAIDASLEAVFIPHIDGRVADKVELTASDHTPVFPRPRIMIGLPAPAGLRAFAGVSYIPPVTVSQVSTHYIAGEVGLGLAPGLLRLGVRGHALYATTRSPVTEPSTRDVLETREVGAELSVGVHLGRGALAVEPYASAGAVSLAGRFRVTVDGAVLRSVYNGPSFAGGVRLLVRKRLEVVTELDAYPGRLTHAAVRFGYLFGG